MFVRIKKLEEVDVPLTPLNSENKNLCLLFCIVFGFHNLPLRGEYRMRLNNENKNLCLLFCIVFGFHYICGKIQLENNNIILRLWEIEKTQIWGAGNSSDDWE